ncbi:hypothetical protein [Haloechinothrix salitolerans]|uniref:Tetratricopeptide repeat-containing protein n=1 Tax=Haloechinothrix salitolerans TaxID=926830 RepID=A0ABW2C956_9PSEU
MAGVNEALLAGLPDRVRRLLAEPPVMEKSLIELNVRWPRLTAGLARMTDAVRLFIITWDPLGGVVDRTGGFATTNGGAADLEIVVYLPTWSLQRLAAERNSTLAAVLGAMAGSAVVTASHHEETVNSSRYPELAARGVVPGLLSDLAAGSALGAAQITAVSVEWEPIGLGAITDLVQHAFGPVDLDRSPVELAAGTDVRQDCPACTGDRFGFPGALAEAREAMCPAHHSEAESVINRRLARANASNPDGWAAIADASLRLDRPHLPNGLAARLPGADTSLYVIPAPAELAERAEAAIEAAGWFHGRPGDFALALGQEPYLAGQLPDWLANLILDLGKAGLGSEAQRVGDALSKVDPDKQSFFDGDVCVALAEAGLADEARARNAANLARWPDDLWIRVHAGDALTVLGDLKGAEEHFDAAMTMAHESDDADAIAAIKHRLRMATRQATAGERGHPTSQRRQPKRKLSKAQRKDQAHRKRQK